jgi:hypothetical protein
MSESFTVSGTVTVRTFAKGLFSALAHDLELRAASLSGTATRDGEEWKASVEVKIEDLRVAGVLRRGHVKDDVLSKSDCAEIERKIRDEVFAPAKVLRATLEGKASAPRVRFDFPAGRPNSTTPSCRVTMTGQLAAHASTKLSMKALGLDVVKGPLGAFSLKDDIEVEVDVSLSAT